MKKKIILKDNNGFSLVELIVVVLVTAILMLAVTVFISTSRSAYQAVNSSATLQEDAITIERVFSEAIMEAKKAGEGDEAYGLDHVAIAGVMSDVFWVRAVENEDETATSETIYCFVLDKSKEQIRYYKDVGNITGMVTGNKISESGKTKLAEECFGSNMKYTVVSDHVKSITVNGIPRNDGTELVCMQILCEYMGKTYTENLTVATRNMTHVPTVTSNSGDHTSLSGGGTGG